MTRPEPQRRPDSSRPDAAPGTEVADRLLSASEGDRAIRKRTRLEADLWAAFEADPLEDCINHPAEKIIEEALRGQDEFPVLEWFRAFSHDAAHFAASVLRCLGRQASAGTASWRADLVREGLAANSVEIRDAAAQAAESWGGMRAVLEAHFEPVPWLRDYIRGIIDDL